MAECPRLVVVRTSPHRASPRRWPRRAPLWCKAKAPAQKAYAAAVVQAERAYHVAVAPAEKAYGEARSAAERAYRVAVAPASKAYAAAVALGPQGLP